MLTKFSAILSLALLTVFISSTHQLQNLCGTDPTVTHVADPSSCHLYIECVRIGSRIIPRLGSCLDSGANYVITDENKNVWCTSSNSHCSDPLWACPPESEHDIMVADPNDPYCQRHRQCRNLSGNFTSCSGGLVFNRNTGLCDYWDYAPCDRVRLPIQCPANYTGFHPGFLCYEYVYCDNGSVLLNLQCNPGMYFNEYYKSCLHEYGNCPRPNNESKVVKAFLVGK